MPLKAETGNSYCNCFFFFKFLLIYFKQVKNSFLLLHSTDGSSGVLMKDKATFAGIFWLHYFLYFHIYTAVIHFQNALSAWVWDWQLGIVLRDPQGQRRVWRRRILLLLRLVLLLVEVAAGPPPPLPAPARTSVWPHRTGWVSPTQGLWGRFDLEDSKDKVSSDFPLRRQWNSREWPFSQPINCVLCF